MKTITIYGIKNCDSVKKAIKYLKSKNLSFKLIDFKETPINQTIIESWLAKTTIDKLFNKRSTTYRNLKLKELNLNEKDQIEWLAKENLLIKRPVLEYQNQILVGFNQGSYDQFFESLNISEE